MIRKLENLIIEIGDVDRRVIFVLIGLAVLIPLLTPVSLPIRETPTTVKFYEGIEEIPKGFLISPRNIDNRSESNDDEVGPGPAPSPCRIFSPTGFP